MYPQVGIVLAEHLQTVDVVRQRLGKPHDDLTVGVSQADVTRNDHFIGPGRL